jgi:membrane protease YdiL (CAAX protease family)
LLLKKLGVKNYFIVLIILLVITTLLVVSTFILTVVYPDSVGQKPYKYEMSTVYEFEPWYFEAESLKVSFPRGGIIVTLYDSSRKRSIMLLGEGTYEQNGLLLNSFDTGGLFLVLEHNLFEEIRGANFFMPVEDSVLLGYIEAIANRQIGIPAIWRETIPLTFYPTEGLVYYYFLTAEGEPILPPTVMVKNDQLLGSLLIYLTIVITVIFIITLFSPDHHYSRYWIHLGKINPGFFSLAIIIPVIILTLAGEVMAKTNGWNVYYHAFGSITAIIVLILSSRYGKIDYLDLGLRRDRIRHGYLLALLTALILVGITRGIPIGISNGGYEEFLKLALLFIMVALPREMLWRGFIQTVISRRLGPTMGLLIMIFLTAAAHYVFLAATEPWMIAYPYTHLELAVLVPGMAAILGYVYMRTENIFSCALLHSLIIWLPGFILFS